MQEEKTGVIKKFPLVHFSKSLINNNKSEMPITTQPLGDIKPLETIEIKQKMDEQRIENTFVNNKKKNNGTDFNYTETSSCSFEPETSSSIRDADKSSNFQVLHQRTQFVFNESKIQMNRSFSNPDLLTTIENVVEAVEKENALEDENENDVEKEEDDVQSEASTISAQVVTGSITKDDFIIVGNDKQSNVENGKEDASQQYPDSSAPLLEKALQSDSVPSSPARSGTPRADTSLTFGSVVTIVSKTLPAIFNAFLKKPWYANRSDEVSIFPAEVMSQYEPIATDVDNDKFLVVGWKETEHHKDELFHLTFAPFGFHTSETTDTEKPICFSVFRAAERKDLMDLLHLCDKKTYLFECINVRLATAKTKIEELVSQIRSKPQYHLIHMAIASDRIDYFSDESIEKLNATAEPFSMQLRSLCHTENCYPVHLAVAMNRVKIVERLLEIEPQLFTESDSFGNNVWHHVNSSACAQSIWDKCPETHRFIDERNNEGQSPLSEAVLNTKPLVTAFLIGKGAKFGRGDRNELFLAMLSKNAQSVVEVVLSDRPEIVHDRDALGNSPIHVACYKESLNALLNRKNELKLDVNIKNNSGETALLVFISSKKPDLLPLLVTLFSHGADMNATDPHGNSVLHKAAVLTDSKKISLECMKFLIAAGADPDKKNDRGETPRHLAACLQNQDILKILKTGGARRCPKGYKGCRSECRYQPLCAKKEDDEFMSNVVVGIEDDYEKTYLTPSEKLNIKKVLKSPRKGAKSRVNLISLDGGGIRGLVIIQTLIAIEEVLGEPVFKYFDWSAGTSTGSLIMAGLATGKSLRQMQQTYLLLKDRVFDGYMPPFDTTQLEKFIQDEFGLEPVSEIAYPRLMISAVNSEKLPVRLEMARNYKPSDKSVKETPKNMPLWMALRRSTAAPVLFKPSEDRYIDGGIISNNPALDLISEVHGYNRQLELEDKAEKTVKINSIVSLGTGQIPCTTIDTLSIDTNSPLQSIKTIKNLAAMFIDQATASEGAPVARSRQWADSLEVPFFRFSAPLSKNIFLSSTSDLDVCTMMWDSYIYCRKHQDYIKNLVEVLRHDVEHPHINNPFIEL